MLLSRDTVEGVRSRGCSPTRISIKLTPLKPSHIEGEGKPAYSGLFLKVLSGT